MRQQIVQGGERFEDSGRSPLQARCVQLARMGCVVFHYDMIGYADNVQLSFELAHRFATQRPEMNDGQRWGLYSPQAESHVQSVMGLQTLNSLRAVDFITSLPDVDPHRIAVTGASGGGTQTFMLSALDPRIRVSVPAVMVSTAMQGGCTCENASLLRVDTGNVEFAALFAPKPLCLLSADDWTAEMNTKGFPPLQSLYRVLGDADNVRHHWLVQFGHNYNYVSRAAMYDWMNRHLQLGHSTPIVEEDFTRLMPDKLTVWDEQHPKPDGGDNFERSLLQWWTADTRQQLESLTPKDVGSLEQYRETVGGAVEVLIGDSLPAENDVQYEHVRALDVAGQRGECGLLRHTSRHTELPMVILRPAIEPKQWVIWLHEGGKAGLFVNETQIAEPVRELLAAGAVVVGVDLLYQGELSAGTKPLTQTPRVANTRQAAAYTFGYNATVFAERSQDVLTLIRWVQTSKGGDQPLCLAGLNGSGHWAAAALALAGSAVDRAAIDTAGFRFGSVREIHSVDFLPGGAKYHDLCGMISLAAPVKLWLAGEGDTAPAIVRATYSAAAQADALSTHDGPTDQRVAEGVAWLLGR